MTEAFGLEDEIRVRIKRKLPWLTVKQILQWADEYHRHRGNRPTAYSGTIGDTGEDWEYVDEALRKGLRGLPSRLSLFRLLNACVVG